MDNMSALRHVFFMHAIKRAAMWVILWITFHGVPQASGDTLRTRPPRPRLVVLLAVDQMRSDYLTRFEHLLLPAELPGGKPGGFRYLMTKGAYFVNAQTSHVPNVTAVGHATMLTGALPYLHGIVANSWYDRALKTEAYCVHDAESRLIGAKPGAQGRSPRNLLVTTVGDELKNAMGGLPRVVSIALKDRAAILMGGRRANLALWFDEAARSWVSSAYYINDGKLPEWVTRLNDEIPSYIEKKTPSKWTLLLPADAYRLSSELAADSVGDGRGLGPKFPHPIEGKLDRFLTSPWANAFALDTAARAVHSLKLGALEQPDLLAISLSAFDAIGHNYGPISAEMQDTFVRLDRQISDFLGKLAQNIPGGLKNVVIAVTADHGVQPNPAWAEKVGLPGRHFSTSEVREKANARLRALFGFSDKENPLAYVYEGNAWLDRDLINERGKSVAEVAHALAAWLREESYVAAAHSSLDAIEGRVPPTTIAKRIASSVFPNRSGDVIYTSRPGNLFMDSHGHGGTDHESATAQDASIPLLLAGAPFRAGRYYDSVSLLDLAPTLSAVLGVIYPSGSEGHVLTKAIAASTP